MKTTITLTLLGALTGFGMVSTSATPSFAATSVAATSSEASGDPEGPEAGQLIISTFLAVCESEVPEAYRACGNATVAGPFPSPTTAREFREEFGLKCETQGQRSDEETYCWDTPLTKRGDKWVR